MTEYDVANHLAFAVVQRTDIAVVPNVNCFSAEADLLRITAARIAHEYEIKTSKSDFRADLKKHKHALMRATAKGTTRYNVPNYFWFAVTPNVCSAADVPPYAGLIVVTPGGSTVERRARRLHADPVSQRVLDYALRGQRLRYWIERGGDNPFARADAERRAAARQARERHKKSVAANREERKFLERLAADVRDRGRH